MHSKEKVPVPLNNEVIVIDDELLIVTPPAALGLLAVQTKLLELLNAGLRVTVTEWLLPTTAVPSTIFGEERAVVLPFA
jgi:hypothetical protein